MKVTGVVTKILPARPWSVIEGKARNEKGLRKKAACRRYILNVCFESVVNMLH